MNLFPTKKEGGFTLIEVMISLGLFTVIMVVGITAILGVNNTYRKTRSMRSAIDNLSFIMEDMARNIRLGYLYRCINSANVSSIDIEDPLDGQNCKGITFEPFWNPTPGEDNNLATADQVVYFISPEGDIFKGLGGANFDDPDSDRRGFPMNSLDIVIDESRSGFTIVGSESGDDGIQPFVLINLVGTVSSGGNTTNFNLQTTVSQRLLDSPLGSSGGTTPTAPTGGTVIPPVDPGPGPVIPIGP